MHSQVPDPQSIAYHVTVVGCPGRLHKKDGSVLYEFGRMPCMELPEIGDRIFGASTAGENVDGSGEAQVEKELFDGVLLLSRLDVGG